MNGDIGTGRLAMTDGTEAAEITTLDSRVVYRNRWMTVREDRIRRRDGSDGIYGVVDKPDFVVVLAVEPDGAMHLVEQYRYPIGARFWELPQGAWEHRPEADMADVARGELQEETGLLAGRLEKVGTLLESYGFAKQRCHVFVARDLEAGPVTLATEEQGLISRRFAAAEVARMVADGTIQDMTTVAALGLARLHRMI